MFALAEKSQRDVREVCTPLPGHRVPYRFGDGEIGPAGEAGCTVGSPDAKYAGNPVVWTPKNPRLAQLAEQIRQLRPGGRASVRRCPSGLPQLDAVLGGGFMEAAVHELVAAEEGVAAYSVALRTAAHAAGVNKWIFYLDTELDLYPPGVSQLGVALGRLVVVRTPRPADALWVCEQVLRCRAVAAVVLPLRSIDACASRRLQLAAEAGGNLGLLIRRDPRGGQTFAASRLRCDPLVGGPGVRRMLVTVLKIREGRPCDPFVVEWPEAADCGPGAASGFTALSSASGDEQAAEGQQGKRRRFGSDGHFQI